MQYCSAKLESGEKCPNPVAKRQSRCIQHNNAYQKSYRGTVMDMAERRGFAKGREAMRKMFEMEFTRLSQVTLNGAEIAHIVRTSPAPLYDSITEKDLQSASSGDVGKQDAGNIAGGLAAPGELDGGPSGDNSQPPRTAGV
jgi:hypothetical protein